MRDCLHFHGIENGLNCGCIQIWYQNIRSVLGSKANTAECVFPWRVFPSTVVRFQTSVIFCGTSSSSLRGWL